MAEESILIRADSSSEMGTGHISRCIGLAQAAVRRGVRVVFVCRRLAGDINDLVRLQGHQVVESTGDDVTFLAGVAERLGPQWIVVDHPGLGLDYEKDLRSRISVPLVVIDGQYRDHLCDFLLNPNVYATEENCANTVPEHCRVLAGYRYFILRDEYLVRKRSSLPAPEFRILVTLGGADPDNITLAICQILANLPFSHDILRFDIVLGPANQHVSQIREFLESINDSRFSVHERLPDLFPLIQQCSLCISAGGITMGEAVYLEKPIIGLSIADNQKRTVETLAARGAIIAGELFCIGEQILDITRDSNARKSLVSRTHGLVDGHGKDRVIEAMCGKFSKHSAGDSHPKKLHAH